MRAGGVFPWDNKAPSWGVYDAWDYETQGWREDVSVHKEGGRLCIPLAGQQSTELEAGSITLGIKEHRAGCV